jgi:hypothetical protein
VHCLFFYIFEAPADNSGNEASVSLSCLVGLQLDNRMISIPGSFEFYTYGTFIYCC